MRKPRDVSELVESELRKPDLLIMAQSGHGFRAGMGYGPPLDEMSEEAVYEEGELPRWGALSQFRRRR